MGKIIRNGVEYSGACEDATAVNYNNSLSGLNAQTVQEGIDELSSSLGNLEFNVSEGKPQWREAGADTWNFFSSGNGTVTIDLSGSASNSTHAGKGYVTGSITININGGKVTVTSNAYVHTDVHIGSGNIETRSANVSTSVSSTTFN